MQGLCNQGRQWDRKTSSAAKKDWKNWLTKLKNIEQSHVRRFMRPNDFGKVMNFSLNHFLMRQSLDMDIAVLSGLSMEQVQCIGACYCESCYLRAVLKKFI